MQCPICKEIPLKPFKLEEDLSGNECPQCEGHWVPFSNYQVWLEKKEPSEELEVFESEVSVNDSLRAMLCPECNRIMLKYNIAQDIEFTLDQCGYCRGIWFDKHEWTILKERNLHDQVHNMFTDTWQKRFRKEISKQLKVAIYEEKLGDEIYTELRKIKEWLTQQPHKDLLLTYLNSEDPYEL